MGYYGISMPYVIVSDRVGEIDRRSLDGPLVIGRSPDCDIVVKDILLSRRHCKIEQVDGQWVVVDLNSKNGTLVDAVRVERHRLQDNDTFRIGRERVTFYAGAIEDAPAAPPRRERPADPVEALAGTVAGFEYKPPVEEVPVVIPPLVPEIGASRRNSPPPSPAPKPHATPVDQDQAYEMLSAVTSNSWEDIYREAKRTVSLTAPLQDASDEDTPRSRPTSPTDATYVRPHRRAWRTLRNTVKRAFAKVTRSPFRRADTQSVQ
jgi:pSer/pThr/pTyr-binding forkhead associated (FHA) protein